MNQTLSGLYEKTPAGLLVPTRKILAPTKEKINPRVLRPGEELPKETRRKEKIDAAGNCRDVSCSDRDYLFDVALAHYEDKTGKSLTRSKSAKERIRNLIGRASDVSVGG